MTVIHTCVNWANNSQEKVCQRVYLWILISHSLTQDQSQASYQMSANHWWWLFPCRRGLVGGGGARILINPSLPVHFFFKISLCTSVPLFQTESVQSGSVRWARHSAAGIPSSLHTWTQFTKSTQPSPCHTHSHMYLTQTLHILIPMFTKTINTHLTRRFNPVTNYHLTHTKLSTIKSYFTLLPVVTDSTAIMWLSFPHSTHLAVARL